MYDQIERLLGVRPFQPFEILLVDQGSVKVANLDFVSLLGDQRSLAVYTLPDNAEIFALEKVVSLKFREPDLMINLDSEHA